MADPPGDAEDAGRVISDGEEELGRPRPQNRGLHPNGPGQNELQEQQPQQETNNGGGLDISAAAQPLYPPFAGAPLYNGQAQQQQQQQGGAMFPPAAPFIHPVSQHLHGSQLSAAVIFYEEQMRNHAAAYANAAANVAWAAAHAASQAAEYAAHRGAPPPPHLYSPPILPPPPSNGPFLPPHAPGNLLNNPHVPGYFPQPNPVAEHHHQQQQLQQAQGPGMPSQLAAQQINVDNKAPEHRRKRQQRLPPDDSPSIPREIARPPRQQRGKIRRRMLRSDGDSSSSGSSFMRYPHHHGKKKKARSDESLLGKTGVVALYEFCVKRRWTLTFTLQETDSEEFDFTVYLQRGGDEKTNDPQELGRGRGLNKVAAKQEAARHALEALLPGAVFDEETGLLKELPSPAMAAVSTSQPISSSVAKRNSEACQMDELAPNLAKRLAIGRDNSGHAGTKSVSVNQKPQQPKRSLHLYPETSTTSEEENESAYYASRGASICSVLLHTMVQIDSGRIPSSPTYTYKVLPLPLPGNKSTDDSTKKLTHQAEQGQSPAVQAMKGPFMCTAQLKVLSLAVARKPKHDDDVKNKNAKSKNDTENRKEQSVEEEEPRTEQILEATGVGSTKREARHVASAKLLALLFPECSNMAEVKAAAEAMREQYASSKALKHRTGNLVRLKSNNNEGDEISKKKGSIESTFTKATTDAVPTYAFALPSDPPLSHRTEQGLRLLLEPGLDGTTLGMHTTNVDEELISSIDAVVLSEGVDASSAVAFRQLSRQKQIDSLVETALLALNDRDEEGRSLPEELTVDDVGRTVLRRADPEDLPWIKKLFHANDGPKSTRSSSFDASPRHTSMAINDHAKYDLTPVLSESLPSSTNDRCFSSENVPSQCIEDASTELVSRLWSSSSIVLLLCRAIAAYEDPPLGCAVLTLGFSMEHGRLLRVSQIASEPHLPQERFVECLQKFATYMKCGFENMQTQECDEVRLSVTDLVRILKSHVVADDEKPPAMPRKSGVAGAFSGDRNTSQQLQSVQEESEQSEDDDSSSSSEKRPARQASKPSKRSRFE